MQRRWLGGAQRQQPLAGSLPTLCDERVLNGLLSLRKIAGVHELLDLFRAVLIDDAEFESACWQMKNFDARVASFPFEPPQHAAIIGAGATEPQGTCGR